MATITSYKSGVQQFLESFPWALPFLWQGDSGLYRLDEERRVTVGLLPHASPTHPGLLVSIASTRSGTIVAKRFIFDHYFSDERTTDPNIFLGPPYHFASERAEWEWHKEPPRDLSEFTMAVEAWIEAWR